MTSDDEQPDVPEAPEERIAMLRDLELEPTRDLPAGVQRTISRWFLGRDLADFYWSTIGDLIREWLSMAFGGPADRSERGDR